MSSPVPQPIAPKTSSQTNEVSIATSISDVNRFFQPKIMKVSKQSPPVLNVDVTEGTLVWDRTASRLYTVSNGVLKYVAFT
jgi:hypothetical protein